MRTTGAKALEVMSAVTKLPEIEVEVEAEGWRNTEPRIEEFAREAALVAVGGQPGTVVVLLADDAFVQELNARHRGKDNPTNVLSFLAPPEFGGAIGDVVLAFETVEREAQEQGKSFADHARHLVVHGVLHLMGYDHEEDVEAEEMEAIERSILARLGIADPYSARG